MPRAESTQGNAAGLGGPSQQSLSFIMASPHSTPVGQVSRTPHYQELSPLLPLYPEDTQFRPHC
jgi:hypothetical protein